MADLKISQLPAATTPVVGTEVLPIVQSGTTSQVSINSATGITRPFTANGVVYASSSSALATGSALTFDGNKLVVSTASDDILRLTATAPYLSFYNGATRIGYIRANTAGTFGIVSEDASTPMAFYTAGAEVMRLSTSGNLGLGVTPSAWSGNKALQVNARTSLYSSADGGAVVGNNLYYNGTNNIYVASSFATAYQQNASGQHIWFTAPSGTAGNAITFTQAMTLDASGNLGIGTSSPAYKLSVVNTSGVTCNLEKSNGASLQFTAAGVTDAQIAGNSAGALLFYTGSSLAERARIDSSGNLFVGKTATGLGTAGIQISPLGYGQFTISGDASLFTNRLGSDGDTIKFYRATTQVGSVSVTATATVYNVTSDYRLKTVIGPVSGSGNRIDALQPVEYTWNANGSHTRGFLAHQFQEVYADSVTGAKDAVDAKGKPVYQAMQASTSEVIADLVAEIQSLRKRLTALEGKA